MLNALPAAWLYRGNVIPAYAGSQGRGGRLDSRLRGNDYDATSPVARKEAMFCHAGVDQWQTMIMPHLPRVSKPQLTTYHRLNRHPLTRLT